MTAEQQIISVWIGNLPIRVHDWQRLLPEMYSALNTKWFDNSLPQLSDAFICEFCDMPRESAGIFIDASDAETQSTEAIRVRPGIRINSKLKELSYYVRIALLHEMVHASGIRGHLEPFQAQIARLMTAGAYAELL